MVSNPDAASSKEVILMLINCLFFLPFFFLVLVDGFFVVRFQLTILAS